ncbi:hypothetical protein FACS1894120_5440 [Clostridia bacterium]|nr:hypothetical protein FACS1894120_5440 [Clostridia bacterium]
MTHNTAHYASNMRQILGGLSSKFSPPVIERLTGLNEEAIKAISQSANDDESDLLKEDRQRVLNLLLSTEKGCLALHCLSAYFFAFKGKEGSVLETKDINRLSAIFDFIGIIGISDTDLADIAFLRATKHLQDLREREE